MTPTELADAKAKKTGWIESACKCIDALYAELPGCGEFADTPPTREAVEAAKYFLSKENVRNVDGICFSVNGEVVLSWNEGETEYSAWFFGENQSGFLKDADPITLDQFLPHVTPAAAA